MVVSLVVLNGVQSIFSIDLASAYLRAGAKESVELGAGGTEYLTNQSRA